MSVSFVSRPGCTLCQQPCRLPFQAIRPTHCRRQNVPSRLSWRQPATPDNGNHSPNDEEFEGLTPEEDWTVPGGYQDSLSSNTELGRAVQDACDELDNLSSLEKDSLTQASELLQKLGYKGNIMQDTSKEHDQ